METFLVAKNFDIDSPKPHVLVVGPLFPGPGFANHFSFADLSPRCDHALDFRDSGLSYLYWDSIGVILG